MIDGAQRFLAENLKGQRVKSKFAEERKHGKVLIEKEFWCEKKRILIKI
jgi:hypothetical protein